MNLQKAISIAIDAHHGQTDKSGTAYILHPLHVMSNMASEDEMVVAVLHDVLEDTIITLEYLKENDLTDIQSEALQLLTKHKGITYMNYIKRLSKNNIARNVKIEDLKHNLDITRLPEWYDSSYIIKKYTKALNFLTSYQN